MAYHCRNATHSPGDVSAVPESVSQVGVPVRAAAKNGLVYLRIGTSVHNFPQGDSDRVISKIRGNYPVNVHFNLTTGDIGIKGAKPLGDSTLGALKGYFGCTGEKGNNGSSGSLPDLPSVVSVPINYKYGELVDVLNGSASREYTGFVRGDYLESMLRNFSTGDEIVAFGVYANQSALAAKVGGLSVIERNTYALLSAIGSYERSSIKGNLIALIHSNLTSPSDFRRMITLENVPSRIKVFGTDEGLPDFSRRPNYKGGLSMADIIRLSQITRPEPKDREAAKVEVNYLNHIEGTYGLTRLGAVKKHLVDTLVNMGSLESEKGFFRNFGDLLKEYC